MSSSAQTQIVQLAAFFVGDEEYVVDILRVREIIRPVPITPVRRGPKFVEGVINLRGTVVPIVDLRRRFGLESDESAHRKIIILSAEGRPLGLIVDRVTEVVRVPRSQIRPAPGLLDPQRAPYFMGVCQHGDRVLILLNVENVVSSEDSIVPPTVGDMMDGVEL